MSFTQKTVTVHLRRGENAEADRVCQEEIAANPGNGYAWHLRGVAAIRSSNFDRAVQYILRAIFHAPGICEMHVNLGVALRALNRLDEAVEAFTEAARLDPSNFQSRLLLAGCHVERGEYEAGDLAVDAALTLQPDSAEAWEIGAIVAHRRGDFDRAFEAAQKAISLTPNAAASHRIVGDVQTRRENYAEAQSAYEAAVRLDPSDREARANFGVLLTRMGLHGEAVAHYREAVAGSESGVQAQFGLATALLAQGQFAEGWPLYAARIRALRVELPADVTQLDRMPVAGDRVLLTTDQGPGEQIIFASLLPDLVRTGAELTVASDDRLVPLLQRSFPSTRFIGRTPPKPEEFDYQIGLADTAKWLRRTFADFPRHTGYLKPESYITDMLRARYTDGAPAQPLVGISWRTVKGTKVSAQKTIPLDRWGPILARPGVTYVSLQYGECDDEILAAQSAFGTPIFKDPAVNSTLDLDSLAAQIAAMDLVITTSNTTAHIAGALNVPTWTFVPKGHGSFWHWFVDRDDSPWYPSVRLFRQAERWEWRPALDQAADALSRFAETYRSAR